MKIRNWALLASLYLSVPAASLAGLTTVAPGYEYAHLGDEVRITGLGVAADGTPYISGSLLDSDGFQVPGLFTPTLTTKRKELTGGRGYASAISGNADYIVANVDHPVQVFGGEQQALFYRRGDLENPETVPAIPGALLDESVLHGVSNTGIAGGISVGTTLATAAFSYTSSNGSIPLPLPSTGVTGSSVWGTTSDGWCQGHVTVSGTSTPIVWAPDGTFTLLPLGTNSSGLAMASSNGGTLAGGVVDSGASIWKNGAFEFASLGPTKPPMGSSSTDWSTDEGFCGGWCSSGGWLLLPNEPHAILFADWWKSLTGHDFAASSTWIRDGIVHGNDLHLVIQSDANSVLMGNGYYVRLRIPSGLMVPATWVAWASTAFSSLPGGISNPDAAPTADPDGDGHPNLMEYLFKSGPLDSTEKGNDIAGTLNAMSDQVSISLVLPNAVPADITIEIQESSDMNTWLVAASKRGGDSWAGPRAVSESSNTDGVTVSYSAPFIAGGYFARYQVRHTP